MTTRRKGTLIICGIAAMCLGTGTVLAQDDGGGPGGGGPSGGGRGPGNFDPAQAQQRMMDNVKERLAFTNDTDWAVVQPLVQKILDTRREVGPGGMGFGRFGGRRASGGNNASQDNRRNAFFQSIPEAEALQKLIDDKAPTTQVKAALEKYRAARKTKQAKLEQAQEDLRKVLSVRQEAEAALMGLVN